MKILIISLKFLLLMTILTGIAYPVFVFGIAKIFFNDKSRGSLIEINGNKIGSELIAQKFDSSIYFQPRPSSIDFLPMPSGASNCGPTSKKLRDFSDSMRTAYIRKNNLPENTNVPVDAVFASASGIDPHISPENANLQFERVCKARNFDNVKKEKLRELINMMEEKPQFNVLGEPRINVFVLNLEMNKL